MQFAQNILNFGKIFLSQRIKLAVRVGIVLKLFLIVIFSEYYNQEQLAFFDNFYQNPSIDPWNTWFESGNDSLNFHYGPSMFIFMLPFLTISLLKGISSGLMFGLAIFVADLLTLLCLPKLFDNYSSYKQNIIKILYWFNPINLIALYMLGLNDSIPILFLLLSIIYLRNKNYSVAILYYIIGLLAKFTIAITLPFILIYLIRKKQISANKPLILLGYLSGTLFALFLNYSSSGLSIMLSKSQELNNLFLFYLDVYPIRYFLIPVTIGVILFTVYRIRFIPYAMLYSSFSLVFLIIIMFTPSSPGWVIWLTPFLLLSLNFDKKFTRFLYLIITLLFTSIISINYQPSILDFFETNFNLLSDLKLELINSLCLLFSIILMIEILNEIKNRNFININSSPLSIGIAGDSSTGKDTLVSSFTGIFPKSMICHISGDDYHRWDRGRKNWEFITHLNPLANNLFQLSTDLRNLIQYKTVRKRHYDHSNGKMTRLEQIGSKEILFSSGLHTLFIPYSEELFDLRVYISIEENLRAFLKIKRDVEDRGKTVSEVTDSLKQRANDSMNFIQGQKDDADLSFHLYTTQKLKLGETKNLELNNLRLTINIKKAINISEIHETLIGVLGLNCTLEIDNSSITINTDCQVTKDQIALGSEMLLLHIKKFFKDSISWGENSIGLMQLLILNQLEKQRNFREVWKN